LSYYWKTQGDYSCQQQFYLHTISFMCV